MSVVAHQHVSVGEYAVLRTVALSLERTEAPGATAGPRGVAVAAADAAAPRAPAPATDRLVLKAVLWKCRSLASNGNKNRPRAGCVHAGTAPEATATASSS